MRFFINLWFWMINIVVLSLMLFYEPVFTLKLLGGILVIGIIGGVLLSIYRRRHR